MTYKQLTYELRCQIYTLQSIGMYPKEIAKKLKIHRSTIYRELKRNTGAKGYRFKQANEIAKERRCKANKRLKKMAPALIEKIEEYLKKYWSPEQISGYLKENLNTEISYETIYLHIWADQKKGGKLYRYLRRKGKKYTSRSKKNAGRGCIPDRIDISERPKIVEKKSRFGDWEGDTIIGVNHKGVILTLVDRKSKFTLIERMNGKHADQVPGLILKAFKRLPRKIRSHTITFDNGKEFSKHKKITLKTGVICYFATPYHSWERGLNVKIPMD